jgi:AcrR family transcriptional regulator
MVVKAKKPTKSKVSAKPEKRTYVKQADVKERIVETTLQLLLNRDPESLTIREIATHANTHHRYIPDYFGGKGPLLAEVLPLTTAAISGIVNEGSPATFPSKELTRIIRLTAWLAVNEPAWFRTRSSGMVLETVSEFYAKVYGLNEINAHHLAQNLVSSAISAVLYPEIIRFNRNQTAEFADIDRVIAEFLASQQKPGKAKK